MYLNKLDFILRGNVAHQQNYDWIKAFSKIKELVIGYRRDQKD